MINDSTQYIARISYGKDSLKMLDVIKSRGLPLDRITTTDVWATDTIPANLPEMMEFKAKMDQIIWSMYHIEVEHLCALNKDGSKKTYEQMFYHVPVRRSQIGQVERERERERERRAPARLDPRIPGSMEPVVPIRTQAECQGTGSREVLLGSLPILATTGAKNSKFHGGGDKRLSLGDRCDLVPETEDQSERIQGHPVRKSPWCKKLKIDKVKTPLFEWAPHEAPQKKYRGIPGHCC